MKGDEIDEEEEEKSGQVSAAVSASLATAHLVPSKRCSHCDCSPVHFVQLGDDVLRDRTGRTLHGRSVTHAVDESPNAHAGHSR